MNCKLSIFTKLIHDEGRLILFNSYVGSIISITPVLNIEDILFSTGLKTAKLRNYLIDNHFIVPESEDEQSKGLLKYYDTIFDRGLTLTLLASEQCNFRCIYCYEKFEKGEMNKNVVDGLIQYLKRNLSTYSRLHVEWFGGEPLIAMNVIRDFSKRAITLAKLAKKPYTAGMTTNGYLLTPELLQELISYKIFNYQITLDGTKDYHDKYRILSNGNGRIASI